MSTPQTRPAFFRSRSNRLGGLVVALVFGLLLWAKLLLVTNHPRTAVADPKPDLAPAAAQVDQPADEPAPHERPQPAGQVPPPSF